jgi:hypothetical protein
VTPSEFLKSPVLWRRADRDHHKAFDTCKAAQGRALLAMETRDPHWPELYQVAQDSHRATREPYRRTLTYLVPAVVMILAYVFAVVAAIEYAARLLGAK